jgi:redox-sensing transcriptional repressor
MSGPQDPNSLLNKRGTIKVIKEEYQSKTIPDPTIRRLSSYLRTLDILEKQDIRVISSRKLAEIEGITDGLVRKDLSLFGSFGVRGVGYHVTPLKDQLVRILGLDKKWDIVLIGTGETSKIFLDSEAFKKKNLQIIKIFDKTPELIGKKIDGLAISNLDNLEKEINPRDVDLAIVALSPPEVQSVINRLGKIGVKGALYFASRSISIPDGMFVRNQDVSIELGTLTFSIPKVRHSKKD